MRLATEADKVPARRAECGVGVVRLSEMTLRESGWQLMPYQWQWSADGSHFQEERRPERSEVTEFLKLRRDIASSSLKANTGSENAKEKEMRTKNQ